MATQGGKGVAQILDFMRDPSEAFVRLGIGDRRSAIISAVSGSLSLSRVPTKT